VLILTPVVLILISVATFVLSWFVVTFCNEFFCSNLAAMLLTMVESSSPEPKGS
jgi:hypothetical protein